MLLRILDVASITLSALVLGVFWGPWLALTRSIDTLTAPVFLTVVHRLDKNLGKPMTVLFPVTVVAIIAMLIYSVGSPTAVWLVAGGLAMFLLSLIVTVAVEVPIVATVRGWTEATIPADWHVSRDRWVSFHLLRVTPGILGVALLTAGALWQR